MVNDGRFALKKQICSFLSLLVAFLIETVKPSEGFLDPLGPVGPTTAAEPSVEAPF